jgi:hypothetical protein
VTEDLSHSSTCGSTRSGSPGRRLSDWYDTPLSRCVRPPKAAAANLARHQPGWIQAFSCNREGSMEKQTQPVPETSWRVMVCIVVLSFLGFGVCACNSTSEVPAAQQSTEVPTPAVVHHPALLSLQKQESQCREHIAKYSKKFLKDIEIVETNDGRKSGLHNIQYTACATDVESGKRRSYGFGCNFGVSQK